MGRARGCWSARATIFDCARGGGLGRRARAVDVRGRALGWARGSRGDGLVIARGWAWVRADGRVNAQGWARQRAGGRGSARVCGAARAEDFMRPETVAISSRGTLEIFLSATIGRGYLTQGLAPPSVGT